MPEVLIPPSTFKLSPTISEPNARKISRATVGASAAHRGQCTRGHRFNRCAGSAPPEGRVGKHRRTSLLSEYKLAYKLSRPRRVLARTGTENPGRENDRCSSRPLLALSPIQPPFLCPGFVRRAPNSRVPRSDASYTALHNPQRARCRRRQENGKRTERLRADSGPTLARRWADSGPTQGRLWPDVGPR